MAKPVLDGYIGIKFEAVCVDKKLPTPGEEYKTSFKENGLRLLQYNMEKKEEAAPKEEKPNA